MEEFVAIIAGITAISTMVFILLIFIPGWGPVIYWISGLGQFIWMITHLFRQDYTDGFIQSMLYILIGTVMIVLVRGLIQWLSMIVFIALGASATALEDAIRRRRR